VTEYDRERVEQKLQARAEEIARRRQARRSEDEQLRGSELSDYDQHPADSGTETFEEELDETTDMILAYEERQVREAQRALAEGTYGKCVDCGRDIPAERLEAVPESTRCVEDQRRYEGLIREQGPPPQDI
jgi:DnaK suppressor protein